MKAVITSAPGRMEFKQISAPVPRADEIMVRVEAVGLCGSDFHLYSNGGYWPEYPQIQGHEIAGIVAEIGSDCSVSFKPGDRVAIEPLYWCGNCLPCRRGRTNCCASMKVMGAHVPGGLAEYVTVLPRMAHPVGNMPPTLAAFVEPMSIGLQAVVRSGMAQGDTVVILGAGPIGQAVLLAAVDRAAKTLVVDRVESRLLHASSNGADATVDSSTASVSAAVSRWTKNQGAMLVIDTTGSPALLRESFELVAPSGVVVIVGISQEDVSIPIRTFTKKDITVFGSRNNVGMFQEAIDVVRSNASSVKELVTHTFSLEEAEKAIQFAMANPSKTEKVTILMDAE